MLVLETSKSEKKIILYTRKTLQSINLVKLLNF